MGIKLNTAYKNGIPLKTLIKDSATIIPPKSFVTLSSGLAILSQDASASVAYTLQGAGAGETELLVVADHLAEFTANADAAFAVTDRGAEVDLVVQPAIMVTGQSLVLGQAPSGADDWDDITDGSFSINIDGTDYNIDGIDFSGVTGMPEIATIIETAIQAETSSTETVTWDNTNDRFIISSASTIADSYVSELGTSTGTVGTDISGEEFMNGRKFVAELFPLEQQIDLGSSSTDVFKVSIGTDAGTVGQSTGVKVKINKLID